MWMEKTNRICLLIWKYQTLKIPNFLCVTTTSSDNCSHCYFQVWLLHIGCIYKQPFKIKVLDFDFWLWICILWLISNNFVAGKTISSHTSINPHIHPAIHPIHPSIQNDIQRFVTQWFLKNAMIIILSAAWTLMQILFYMSAECRLNQILIWWNKCIMNTYPSSICNFDMQQILVHLTDIWKRT